MSSEQSSATNQRLPGLRTSLLLLEGGAVACCSVSMAGKARPSSAREAVAAALAVDNPPIAEQTTWLSRMEYDTCTCRAAWQARAENISPFLWAPHTQLRHSVMIFAYHLQLQKRMRQSHRLSTFIIGLWLSALLMRVLQLDTRLAVRSAPTVVPTRPIACTVHGEVHLACVREAKSTRVSTSDEQLHVQNAVGHDAYCM